MITDTDLKEIDSKNWIFALPRSLPLDDFIIEMHTQSGLLEECYVASTWPMGIDEYIREWLNEHGIKTDDRHPLCGSSVHFDRAWLRKNLWKTHDIFGYRNIDISTITELAKRWKKHDEWKKYDDTGLSSLILSPKREIHRALPDLEDTIALASIYREYFFA
jgi:oligoribonuclease